MVNSIPIPICEEHPEYNDLYMKAWELAYTHIKHIDGMPQTPYMDEAFCETQVWIWDSCFMSLFCKYGMDIFPGVETLNNFYQVLYNNKSLPKVIPPKSEPIWTEAIPGIPYEMKIHLADNPPLFAWSEYENALMKGDKSYLKELLYEKQFLQKHFEWMENLKEHIVPHGVMFPTTLISENLGYKWDGGCSGMDNTPRGRKGSYSIKERPNNKKMLWIDAICQQSLAAKMISKMFDIIGDLELAEKWNQKFIEKRNIINNYYWDKIDKFYYDIDCKTNKFYKVMTIASYWALTAGVASKEQAEYLVEKLLDSSLFGGKVPFVSLARNDKDFEEKGRYWRGSVWLPTAYATLKGLTNYKFYKEAQETASKLLDHMSNTYLNYSPHTIWECYAPVKCEPGTVPGSREKIVRPDFCGWSAIGPISIYIEFVLGFHTINAFENVVEWEKPKNLKGKIGIKNLKFGNIITDIEADDNLCVIHSNNPYMIKISGKAYNISRGINKFEI